MLRDIYTIECVTVAQYSMYFSADHYFESSASLFNLEPPLSQLNIFRLSIASVGAFGHAN